MFPCFRHFNRTFVLERLYLIYDQIGLLFTSCHLYIMSTKHLVYTTVWTVVRFCVVKFDMTLFGHHFWNRNLVVHVVIPSVHLTYNYKIQMWWKMFILKSWKLVTDSCYAVIFSFRQLIGGLDKPSFSRITQTFRPQFLVHNCKEFRERQVCPKR
jgi:hypothetical protein